MYSKDGVTYQSDDMKVMTKITLESLLPSFEIKSCVEEIVAGKPIDSAFYFCRKKIGKITFERSECSYS